MPLEALAEQLGDGRWLLILDNLEQVVDVTCDLGELLARCDGVAILATSRTALGWGRAGVPSAIPAVAGRPYQHAAGGVCLLASDNAVRRPGPSGPPKLRPHPGQCVGGSGALPAPGRPALAIELAAARTRLLDPDALLRRLSSSLDTLGAGAVDLPERQRTLRATVEWSVGLLDNAERSLLETVAVFVDGSTIDAAAQVAGLGPLG